MVKSPQIADQIIPRNGDNATPYLIPFDFSTTAFVQVQYSDREMTSKWDTLVENIDYTISINLGQGYVTLIDPDTLTDFNFLRLRRIRPAAQPDAWPNAYTPPGLEGKADNHMEVTQQNTSTIGLLEDRDPLDIVPPHAEVDRFTLINSLDPNRLSGSSLIEQNGRIKSDIDFLVDGTLTVRVDCNVGNNITATYNISAGNNISATQNLTAGSNLTVGSNATVGGTLSVTNNTTVGGSLSVTGNAIVTANLSVAGDITGDNLTIAVNSNLNYVFANSAVITVIETNDLVADDGEITNLESTSIVAGNINTNTLTVNTTFTVPSACNFAVTGGTFGWSLNPTTGDRTNLVLGTKDGRMVITNELFPEIPTVTVDPDYIAKGGPNGEVVNSLMTDDGVTVRSPNLEIADKLVLADDAKMEVKNAQFGWNLDVTDTQKTNLILGLDNGNLVITNDLMPTGGGGSGDINVLAGRVAKGAAGNALVSSNITDDGTTVTIDSNTEVVGNLSCAYLTSTSIDDDGTTVALSKPLTVAGNTTVTGSVIAPNVDVNTYLTMGFGASMVANGATFLFDFVGDFESKPYLQFSRGVAGVLKLTNAALPAVDVSSKYDSSGVLSGFTGSIGAGTITISAGTGVVWDGSKYEEVSTSAPIVLTVPTTSDSYVLLRWDGSGGLEAYYQETRPSSTQKVQNIYLYFITTNNGAIVNLFNRIRNLNQQLEQVIDMFGLAVPYSNMSLSLTNGTTKFIRNAGSFKAFGIKNVPTGTDKYDTSTIFSIADNAPSFTMMDVNRANITDNLVDFTMPPQYLSSGTLTEIPADSWGYFKTLVNAYGKVIIIYPVNVYVSLEANSGDAQRSLEELNRIRDFKVDGYAVIGMLGIKGGSTTFESATSIFYENLGQVGGEPSVIEINLPDPNQFDIGYRMTVIDVAGGNKEWYGMPDNVKTASIGQEAYYDTTNTISGRDSRIKTGTPGYYAVYDSTGLALEGSTGPVIPTSPVKDGTVGKPAYYDTVSTVSSSTGHIVPNPAAGDVDKVLSATAEGIIGWVDLPDLPTSPVKTGTIGQLAYYDTNTTVSSTADKAAPNPTANDVNKVLGATAIGTVGWVDQTSSVKPATAGQPTYYDTDTTVSGSTDKLVPLPALDDVDKVLGATAEGAIGWVDQTGSVNDGTIGYPAVYSAINEVSSSTDLLVERPSEANLGQVYTALGAGSAGWRDLGGSIDQTVITKVISDGQQAGDILTTLSKRRVYSTGRRIYDDFSRREILALNGQTINLMQYPGLYLKADLTTSTPAKTGSTLAIPAPIQGTGPDWAGYRHVRFFRTPTNGKYVLEVTAAAYNSTTGITVYLGTVNPKTGAITRIHTHTSWAGTPTINLIVYIGMFFVVDEVNNYFGYNIYGNDHHIYFYNLENGTSHVLIGGNKWDLALSFDYGIFNGYLYVFYKPSSGVACDKILINATTDAPNLTYERDGEIVMDAIRGDYHRLKQIDENTLLVWIADYTTSFAIHHIVYNLSNDTVSSRYDMISTGTYAVSTIQGGIYYDGLFYWAWTGTNSAKSQTRGWIEVETALGGFIDSVLPGTASVGWSYYDQHPKYTNVCACLKNNKSQLFISYDYGDTWEEKEGFSAATQFWPSQAPSTTTGSIQYTSRSIWLDENNTNMIFTGWLTTGGTNEPFAVQPLGPSAGTPPTAVLPTWDKGSYLISTEFEYLPVTWFDAGGGKVIGETYHTRRLPLARTVTQEGTITDIDWASGTTPPDTLNGFACSPDDISTWAVSDRGVYLASDGYSFAQVYEAPAAQTINNVAYYDSTRCIVTVYQTTPAGNTNIGLVNKDGNVQVIYNSSSAYPILGDLVATEYYIVAPKVGIAQVVWADRGDLVFSAVNVGSEIKKVASAGLMTYGISIDGVTLYAWDGKGQNETVLRTFTGVILTDVAATPGKVYVIGNAGDDGVSYVYDGTDWLDHVPNSVDNSFNVLDVSPRNDNDLIIGCDNGFYKSSDGFDTSPLVLNVAEGTVPTGITNIAIDITSMFTIFFGIDGDGKGFNYRSGDVETSIITDMIEHIYDSTVIGMSPIGYLIRKKVIDDFWTRTTMLLSPSSTYTQRQTIAEGIDGAIFIQDDEGRIGISTDGGETFNVATASPIGESGRGGAFIGGLAGNTSLLALGGGRMLKSSFDWSASEEYSPFNADQSCTCFSRDLSRKDIVYAAVSQKATGDNICKVVRFNSSDSWEVPTELLSVTLTGGRYFTYIASYNDRIVVAQSDGAIRYSIDAGLTWSAENTTIMDSPATVEGISSVWIENTTDCIYIAKHGGVFYNTFQGLEDALDWIVEDVPVASDQKMGAHLVTKKRTYGIIGNVGSSVYWRRYDSA